jgi:hypothetical protein
MSAPLVFCETVIAAGPIKQTAGGRVWRLQVLQWIWQHQYAGLMSSKSSPRCWFKHACKLSWLIGAILANMAQIDPTRLST